MPSYHASVFSAKARFGALVCCLAVGVVSLRALARTKDQAATTASVAVPARANPDPRGENELRAIFGDIRAAILQHDAKVIEKYYSPDYVMTFSDGKRGGFENSLRTLTDESRNEWRVHDRSNERFLFYGDTAIATFTVHSQWLARASQKQFDVREHVTQTWIRRDGRWTLVATHVTSIDASQQ